MAMLDLINPIKATQRALEATAKVTSDALGLGIDSTHRALTNPFDPMSNIYADVTQTYNVTHGAITEPIFSLVRDDMTDEEKAMLEHQRLVNQKSSESATSASESAASAAKAQAAYDAALRAHQQAVNEAASKSSADAAKSAGYSSAMNVAYKAGLEAAKKEMEQAGIIQSENPEGVEIIQEDAQSASMVPYTNQRSGFNVTALLVYGLIGYGIYKLITGNKKKGD